MSHRSRGRSATVLLIAMVMAGRGQAQEIPPPRFKAVAFDYFVIFDPNSVIPAVEAAYPGKGAEFTRAWLQSSSNTASCDPSRIATPTSSRSPRTPWSTPPGR